MRFLVPPPVCGFHCLMKNSCTAALFVLLPLVTGCGVSSYDADYKARVAAFLGEAAFAELDPAPREFADGRVRVHLPIKFEPVDEESRPTSLAFLRNLEEATAFNTTLFNATKLERRPVVAVAAVPTSRRRPDDLKREISEWIEQDGAFRGRTWERRKVEAAHGGPAEWDVLSLDGEQGFEATTLEARNEKGEPMIVDQVLKGSGAVWLSAAADREYCVIFSIRMPDEVADQFQTPPATLAELMARRVEIVAPPGADEPAVVAR